MISIECNHVSDLIGPDLYSASCMHKLVPLRFLSEAS